MAIPSLNSLTSSTGKIFVPDEISTALNMLIRDASCVEKLAKHVKMKRSKLIRRKQSTGVNGYWVDAMATKTKDAPTFEPYELEAEKMAVIVPLEDQLIEDADTDLAKVLREDVVGAFAEDLDRSYMGYEPTSPFAASLSGNTPAANTIVYGAAGVDLAEDFNLAMATVEANGFEITGAIAHPSVKAILRGLRDTTGSPIFATNLKDEVTRFAVYGIPICFTRQVQQAGSPLASEILLFYRPYVFVGDRVGLQISKSNEATLTQGTEADIHMWEQDMTAFRFVTRKAFAVKDNDALAKITGVTL